MALAQYVAGMAFSNVGLGVVHGMAHPMGSLHNIPHGVANALLLPTIMEFNAPVCREKYVEIAKAMGAYKEGMTQIEAAQAACDAVRALVECDGDIVTGDRLHFITTAVSLAG